MQTRKDWLRSGKLESQVYLARGLYVKRLINMLSCRDMDGYLVLQDSGVKNAVSRRYESLPVTAWSPEPRSHQQTIDA